MIKKEKVSSQFKLFLDKVSPAAGRNTAPFNDIEIKATGFSTN